MNETRAYETMLAFLTERYERLPSDDLGSLLGDLSLQPDGRPGDPAVVAEWARAIEQSSVTRSAENILPMHRKAS